MKTETGIEAGWAIVQRRYYFGRKAASGLLTNCVFGGSDCDFAALPTYAAARRLVNDLYRETYHLSHDESGRPDYSIVRVGSLRFRAAYRRTFGGLEW